MRRSNFTQNRFKLAIGIFSFFLLFFTTPITYAQTVVLQVGWENSETAWSGSNISNRSVKTDAPHTGSSYLYGDGSSGNGRRFTSSAITTNANKNYHAIFWVRTDVASTAGNGWGAAAGTYPYSLSPNVWTRVSSSYTQGASSSTKSLNPTFTISAATKMSLDNVIVYESTVSTIDTINPSAPSFGSNTTTQLNWTNGSDGVTTGATGISTTILLKTTNLNAAAPVLQNQAPYSVGQNPNGVAATGSDWTIVSIGILPSATFYSITTTADTKYAIIHRDVAYNYSTASVSTVLAATGSAPPVLTAASGATVDNDMTITFTDDASWRAAVTTVTVNGTTLTSGTDYSLSAGQLVLKPSGGKAVLRSSGSKAVAVTATGYLLDEVTQSIGAGVASKLGVTTQPAALYNGFALGTQPVVAVQDQYGNTTSSTASVSASVGSGSFTLNGTTTVSASSGLASFSGLTVTAASAVTGATMTFSSSGLTSTTSSAFNIAAPEYLSINTAGVAAVENFNSMGVAASTSVSATVPSGIHLNTAGEWQGGSGTITTVTNGSYGSTGSNAMTTSSSGGTHNVSDGVNASSTDRALAIWTSGSYSNGRSIILRVKNNTGAEITEMNINFDYEKYRDNTTSLTFNFYHGANGSTWTSNANGDNTWASGTAAVINPPVTTSKSVALTGISIASGADYYFKWTYNGSAATNSQGVAIDNISIVVPSVPVLGATTMTNIRLDSARATSTVISDGGFAILERGFVYGSNVDPTVDDIKISDAAYTTGSLSALVEYLSSNSTYYIRSFATNERGTAYGSSQTFTTLDYPVLTTTAATGITATSASLGGTITSDGGASVTERGVVYATSSSPTIANTKVTDASTGTGSFTSTLNGLTAATTYYVRAYATNVSGTHYGDERSFTTLANAPTITTTAVSSITGVSASSGGNVTADGGATVTERGIVYATASNPTTSDNKIINGSTGTGSFTSSLTGLANNTTYYVRAYATNSIGTSYGSQESFTTLNKPTVTTTAASLIAPTSASAGGNVTADGGDAVTERGVVYSTSSNPTIADSKVADGSGGTGAFSVSITGLTSLTTYHIRAYAINNTGTSYGSDLTFTTISGAIAPTVTTATVSNLASSSVTLGGSVDSDGGDAITERGVVYGATSNPTTSDNKIADGTASTGAYTTDVTGLTPGATYHVRAYAINSIGTSYGSDVAFTMNAVLPTVTTAAASNVAQTTATTGGNVTYDGGATVTERGVVYSTTANPTVSDTKIIEGSTGTGSFTSNLTGLGSLVVYHVRAYAINSVGTAYGNNETFTTLANSPTVTTSAVTSITDISAAGGGNVTSDGGDAVTERGLVISTTSNPTTADTKITASGTTGTFTGSFSGLSPLTTYHVRAYAINNIGTSYGADVSFSTLSSLPVTQASAVNFSSVTLNGMTINFSPGSGSNSIVVVKSGSSVSSDPVNATSYTANTAFGSGSQLGAGNYIVYNGTGNSVSITGLSAGTTYHVAVYSFNGSSGSESYLTTSPATGNQATNNTDYRSIASGNWTNAATWEKYNGTSWVTATEFPTVDKGNITIQAGHTVALDTSISIDEMTIAATGQLNINASKTLTVVNGSGNDLTVNGYLKNSGKDSVVSGATMVVAGTYEHAVNGGVVPTSTWSDGSTCLITGVTNSTATTGFSQNFYNLTWNCPNQTANLNMGMYNTTIRGDFNFLNGGAGAQETALSLAGAGAGPNNTINIVGNFNVNSSVNTNQICAHRSGSASTVTNLTVNIQGNLNISNGSFYLTRNTGIATMNWNLYGNLNMTGGVINSSHTAAQLHFAKTGTQTFSKSAGTLTAANLVIDGVSTVDAGTSAFDGTATLTINSGATLISANASGSITTTGTKTLNSGANYVYNGSAAQTMPASITAANNITVNNSAGITIGAPASVTGTLTLTNGKLTLGNNSLTLSNAISGASSSNYIVTSGTGTLKYLSVGNSSTTYPIGSSSTSYSPLTLTNTGTTNDIGVRASATFVKSLYNTSKAVGLQWNITSSAPGTVANATFNWNTGDQGASFNNTATGEIGVASGTRNYSVTSLGTLSGTSKSATGLALDSTNNYIAIGNTDAVYIPEILGFDVSTLTGGSGSFGASPYSATTLNANLTSSGLVRGSGLTTSGTASASAWGAGGGFNSASSALGITGNKFITFTVKPNSGYSTDLFSLNPISYRTSSSGPNAILIQYQINSGSFADLLSTSLTTNTTTGQLGPIDLSGVASLQKLQSNETVTFRLVPFGASSSTGTFYINNVNASTSSDLALIGKVNTCSTYSDAPLITTPICAGATSINGTSTEADGSNIDLYLNGTWNQSVVVNSGAWSANTSALTAGTVITAYATASGECLSTVSASVTVGAPTSSSSPVAVCSASLPYNWNGNNYSAAGTYTALLTNAAGCDSVATLILTVNNGTFTSSSASVCDTYTWSANGQTYTESGTYVRNYSNANGCPSADTLLLTITASTSNTTTASACDSYTWSVNGQTYTTSGARTSVSGCHTEYLNLTITTSTSNTTTTSACDSYTWSVNGNTYTSSGSYTSVSGCHTEYLNLTITASSSNTTTESVCDSYTWSVNGTTYTSSGNYSVVTGCHTEYLNLTITASSSNTTNATVCDSYVWSANGQTYTTSGSRTYVSGCHTEILNLTIVSSTSNTSSITVCGGYTWNVTGQTYTASGSYTSVNGCASQILNLTVNQGMVLSFATQPSRTTRKVSLNFVAPAYNVVPAGSDSYTYQWYRNSTDSNIGGTLIAGATSSSYVPATNTPSTSYYYCVITNQYGCSSPSNPSGFLTVCAP